MQYLVIPNEAFSNQTRATICAIGINGDILTGRPVCGIQLSQKLRASQISSIDGMIDAFSKAQK